MDIYCKIKTESDIVIKKGENMLEEYIDNLNLFYSASNIPFCVFDNTPRDIYRCPDIKGMECSAVTMGSFCERLKQLKSDKHLPVFFYSNFCFFAIIKLEKNINILLGPVVSMPMTFKEFCRYNESVIISEDMLHFYKISQKSPIMSLSRFIENILMFIKLMFNENIRKEEILTKKIETYKEYNKDDRKANSDKDNIFIIKRAADFQKMILHYMRSGNVFEIKKEFTETDFFYLLKLKLTTIEQLRQIYFGYIIICCINAMEMNVDIHKAEMILETYKSKEFFIKSVDELKAFLINISVDYCNEIDKVEKFKIESQIVKKCVQYINNNIQSRISLSELSEYCNVSMRTINRHFNECYGMSVAKYIMQKKLKETAFLLVNTDMSFSQISNHFSFSSQSHFNNAFKKQYLCTPQMYRDINRNKKNNIIKKYEF